MTFDAREQSVYEAAPVEAYLWVTGATILRETPNDTVQTVDGQTYTHAEIRRGGIDLSGEAERGALEVTVPRTHPIAVLFIPGVPTDPVMLTIYGGHRTDAEWVTIWAGEVVSCQIKGAEAALTCLPVSRHLRRTIPTCRFGRKCNWPLFSARCGLSRDDYRVVATVTAVDGVTVQAAAFDAHADGYFTGGELQGSAGESHMVTAHVGDTLTLLTPFRTLEVGATVFAWPGCDRTLAACAAFGNGISFSGFPWSPMNDLFKTGVS